MRVLSEAKEQLGVMPTAAAMDMARDLEVDLVLLVPDASPPVCRCWAVLLKRRQGLEFVGSIVLAGLAAAL